MPYIPMPYRGGMAQMRVVPSGLPVAIQRPSWLKATASTWLSCGMRAMRRPVVTSQSWAS